MYSQYLIRLYSLHLDSVYLTTVDLNCNVFWTHAILIIFVKHMQVFSKLNSLVHKYCYWYTGYFLTELSGVWKGQ
jgi:hypothetical protein